MNILVIHNSYGKVSGEEIVVDRLAALLQQRGHNVLQFRRSSEEIPGLWFGKVRAFFSGIYSWTSRYEVARLLRRHRPDVVHVHNLFPLISPSILPECRRARVPVVMTVHNYRLVCPNGLHLSDGAICERCLGGREYRCVVQNCERNLLKSTGYAVRNYVARVARLFLDNVTVYAPLTDFQRRRLVAAGYPGDRMAVIPNMIPGEGPPAASPAGNYVGYVGRISPEKDLPTLLAAAAQCPDVPFRVAGDFSRMPELLSRAPANVQFVGHLDAARLSEFYRDLRMLVLPSKCFEAFPLVLVEAMLQRKPVICSNIGGLPEIVEEGVTGLLFQTGNAAELGEKVRSLWSRPDLCRRMGEAGRAKAVREYSAEKYYERLLAVYRQALTLGPGGPRRGERMARERRSRCL